MAIPRFAWRVFRDTESLANIYLDKKEEMIDELSKVTREEDWAKVKNLLYRHWVTSSQIIYPAQLPKPWEFVSDEVKIGIFIFEFHGLSEIDIK